MPESTIDSLRRYLEVESQATTLQKLPPDTYTRFASYMQQIRRVADANGEDLATKLVKKQTEILQGMINQLLRMRLGKATGGVPAGDLLPEEKYLFGFYQEFHKQHKRFVSALSNGQPSFFVSAHKTEMSKRVVVRFLKPVGDIIGFDLKRYGPFQEHDLAVIPFGNAEVLANNGEAAFVQTRDSA